MSIFHPTASLNTCQITYSDYDAIEKTVSKHASENILEIINGHMPNEAAACQAVLYEAYQNLGDVDPLYGCGSSFLQSEAGRINHLAQEGGYFKAMAMADRALGGRRRDCEEEGKAGGSRAGYARQMMSVLSKAGLYHLMDSYLASDVSNGERSSSPELEAYQFECAWRLGQWKKFEDDEVAAPGSSFSRSHYAALRSVALGEKDRLEPALTEARRALCLKLGQGSKESAVAVYKVGLVGFNL